MSGTLPDYKESQHGRNHLPGHSDAIPGLRLTSLIYDFEVTSPQTVIDTMVDGAMAGELNQSFAVMEAWFYGRIDEEGIGGLARVTFNGDNGNHYWRAENEVSGSGPAVLTPGTGGAGPYLAFRMPAASGTAGAVGMFRISVPGYSRDVLHKAGESQGGLADDSDSDMIAAGFRWAPDTVQAITQLTVTSVNPAWVVGTRLMIVGF